MIELAQVYIDTTNTVVFLTGKAGTGKTTFLRHIRQTSKKKLVIIAPTGVAAINAGGMTIHSFFQLPFGPLLPNSSDTPDLHYNPEKRSLLQNLELLIIDEISMVRPDVLDQIDVILRNVRGNGHPFGGVQLLLIGDLAQLAPIIRDEEWVLLRPYYATPYFFSSLVLLRCDYVRIELDKVYRQSDEHFVQILNEMREQKLSPKSLERLNSRFIPEFRQTGYITLTTHNSSAQKINKEWLDAIDLPEVEYKATIHGDFPADAYPTEAMLKLKIGAQVMFVKNDSSAEKKYFNGKIGTVTKLTADTVTVDDLEVQALEWSNVKYEADDEGIMESNAGSFAQIPLKTAWAITIHKSQGLTFEKAVIDVAASFAHGQAYVALSRCRSLEGLVLRSPINPQNIIGDPAVARFNLEAQNRKPNEQTLVAHQEAFRIYLLTELFNFNTLRNSKFEALLDLEILEVATKLQRQLPTYPIDRIQKAAAYFKERFEITVVNLNGSLSAFIGTSKELAAKADELIYWLMDRIKLLEAFTNQPFTTDTYLTIQRSKKQKENKYLKALNAKPNEKLFETLLNWRDETAQKEGILASMLFSEQTLTAIAAKLPATLKTLSAIKGVGPEKTNRYGAVILNHIRNYQQTSSGAADQASLF